MKKKKPSVLKRILNTIGKGIEHIFKGLYYLFSLVTKNKWVVLLASAAMIGVGIFFYHKFGKTVQGEIVGTIVGLLATFLFANILYLASLFIEDNYKVTNSPKILKKYNPYYQRHVLLNNGDICDYYYDLSICKFENFFLSDDPGKHFKLDGFIEGHYTELIGAHQGSYKQNDVMLRIDDATVDIENKKLSLSSSRTTYYNHLVTNRALDFPIKKSLSLRNVYEPSTLLKPLSISSFSNHLGLIGITKTRDGFFIIHKRSMTATISKNCFVAPLATGVSLPHTTSNRDYDYAYTKAIKTSYIESFIKKHVNCHLLNTKCLDDAPVEDYVEKIELVGYGRDIREGGKPHLFYLITTNLAKDDYLDCYHKCQKNRHNKFDRDSKIFAVKPSELSVYKNKLHIDHYDKESKKSRAFYRKAENNLIALLHCLEELNLLK